MDFRIVMVVLLLSVSARGQVAGRFAQVEGEVFLNKALAKKGLEFSLGDALTTRDGKATLLLGEESVVYLGEKSSLTVKDYHLEPGGAERAMVELKFGKTKALVHSKGRSIKNFKFRSRTATLGVRGTELFIDNPQNPSEKQRFLTLDGLVEVQMPEQPEPFLLKERQVIEVGPTGSALPVQVRELKREEVKQMTASVSPPPPGGLTKSQLQNGGPQGERPPQGFRPPPRLHGNDFIPFDPTADGGLGAPVRLHITLEKKP